MKTLTQTRAASAYRMAMGLMTMQTTDNSRITETAILEHKYGRPLTTLGQINTLASELYDKMHPQDRQWNVEDAERELARLI